MMMDMNTERTKYMKKEMKVKRYNMLKIQIGILIFLGMELNVANISSPLTSENRHSAVDMRVWNLKWYGPSITKPGKVNPTNSSIMQQKNLRMWGAAPFIVTKRIL